MIEGARPLDYMYDEESYPNVWLCTVTHLASGTRWIFEITEWLDQSRELVAFLYALKACGATMVGFNNLGYDYPVLHFLLDLFHGQGFVTPGQLYAKSQQIISSGDRFANIVWERDQFVPQMDLFRIHHFDNIAKATSLKILEFNMRSPTVEDLPFDPSLPLTYEQKERLIPYNCHDVAEQSRFYGHSLDMIHFREAMSAKYGKNFLNHNDTKIGKDFFIMELEKIAPGICFTSVRGKREPRQTHRTQIPLSAIIFPNVWFTTPDFQRVLAYLQTVVLTDTVATEEFKGLSATMRGFSFNFGTGGIHGSVEGKIVRADQDHEIIDVDVKSYYPRLAIVNRVYPEHLSEMFCDVYADLYNQRSKMPKKSHESGTLKLAMNGVYGDSNNIYSPFYDPAYTMTITINGQLLLCMLAEWLLLHQGIEPIQINTDGITCRVHRDARPYFDQCFKAWQDHTQLELESVNYDSMFIRDVNNYIAVGTDRKIKRKGDYQWYTGEPNNISVSRTWNQNWSALVVPKAVEAVLVDGADLVDFINRHDDPYDFMLRERVNRTSRLCLQYGPDQEVIHHPWAGPSGDPIGIVGNEPRRTPLQSTVRYHIARSGPSLVKVMPQLLRTLVTKPTAAKTRTFRINKGWSVRVCNKAEDFSWPDLNRDWYVEEAKKLLRMES